MDELRQLYQRELAARGFTEDAAQSQALSRLQALRDRVMQRPGWLQRLRPAQQLLQSPRGIYLWGGVGRGKTWLMDLFYTSLAPLPRTRVHFHHFMRDIHAALQAAGQRREPLEFLARKIGARTRVLCLDELYVSDIADAMILATLFAALLRQGLVLVVTSNAPPAELYRDGLQRSRFLPAIALLQGELEIVHLDGGIDYRLRTLQQHAIYLDQAAPDTPQRLQRLFDEVADELGESDSELTLQGRTLRALRRRGDVVWFDFAPLCEGTRSQLDYVELAQEFNTVIVSGIPVFATAEQDDAARRFIALVDEFYDQGVKLIVTAAAQPARLYQATRLRLEFERTASRLMEMRTADYLARPRRG